MPLGNTGPFLLGKKQMEDGRVAIDVSDELYGQVKNT